jgi:outer membrane protein OmpA-like peptidoglycan-associated protein
MCSSRLSSLSRILMVACAVGLSASTLSAQSSAGSSSKSPSSTDTTDSKIDVFLGYSYVAFHGSVTIPYGANIGVSQPLTYSAINYGAIGSFNYFFSKYVGGQIEYANHPDGNNDGLSTAAGGLVFRYPTEDIVPFVHADVGAARLGGPFKEPYTWGPTLDVGGGLDYRLPFMNNRFGLRLFQADYQYIHDNFGPQPPFPTGGRANLKDARLSAGLLIHFGTITPPPPVTYSCALNPDSVYPGDPVTITGTATNLNPKRTVTYSWSGSNGASVKGNSSTGQIDTSSLAPGSYTITGHVSEGQKAGEFADCTANLTVKQFEPPTLSCSANPSTVQPGGTSTITAQGVSPQNRTLTYNYSASAGQISGTGSSATLSTEGAPSGPITVTCNVQDDKGQTATAQTTVNVEAPPPPPPAPKVKQLCSITFDRDKRRPGRVDNEAKACLDDVALNLQQQADATAVVVGEAAPTERHADVLAAQRAVNTKDYLVKEKGIDASRISVRTGTQGNKEVENYLVPAGANFDNDVPSTTPVDESKVHVQARTAAAVHHHRRKATPAPQ